MAGKPATGFSANKIK